MTRNWLVPCALATVCFAGVIWNCSSSDDGSNHDSKDASNDGPNAAVPDDEWPAYGRDPGGARYSPLTDIRRENVTGLKVAWTYRAGYASNPNDPTGHENLSGTFKPTPLYRWGMLYLSTGFGKAVALDPDTGAERWAFEAPNHPAISATTRGVSSWEDASAAENSPCKRRIYLGTNDARLIALDATNGKPCTDFARGGTIDLTVGIDDSKDSGIYTVTSPPAVVNGVVVVGTIIGDDIKVKVAPGTVRGFDARTGALSWSWDPIPRNPGDPDYDKWSPDAAATSNC